MSMALFSEIKRLRAEVNQLQVDVRELRLSIAVLAERPVELPIPIEPKRRGRPPKVAQ
jgi:hypothetical protein